jgi:hypothetical protein
VRQEDVDTDYLFGSFLQRFGGLELPGDDRKDAKK